MSIYPTLISWELFHVQRDWCTLPKAESAAASAWSLSGEAGIGEFPSILLNTWILSLWIKVFVELVSKICICPLHPSTSLLKNFFTAANNFPEFLFQEGAGSKSLALPELSFKKLNHMLMAQGSWHEHWKACCSFVEAKAASPAALPWQGTKIETADSSGSSGTETQDSSAEEGPILIFFPLSLT